MAKRSPGACSLLHEAQDEILQGEGHDLSRPKISHCHYNVITYGLSPTNKWSASSILANAIGGSDYDLVSFSLVNHYLSLRQARTFYTIKLLYYV